MRDFADLVYAEWTKLTTVRSWVWWLVGGVVGTVALTALWASYWQIWVEVPQGGGVPTLAVDELIDMAMSSVLQMVVFTLAAVLVVAVLYATSEYQYRTLRTTFTASPRRVQALLAKAVVVAATGFCVTLVAITAASAAVFLVKRAEPEGICYGDDHGWVGCSPPSFSFSPVPVETTVAVLSTAVTVALLAVIATCLAMAWQRTARPVVVLVATVVVPYLFLEPAGPGLGIYGRVTPLAGFHPQQASHGGWTWFSSLPADLGVLVLWTAGALVATAVVLRRRDAVDAPSLSSAAAS